MVVYTVSFSFQNIGNGYNQTNFSIGTTYINSLRSNKINLNGSDLTSSLTSLQTQINNVKPCITGVVAVPAVSANQVIDAGVTIANFPYIVSSTSPIIQCTLNNRSNNVYINNCFIMGISSQSGSQGSNYNFNIRIQNGFPTTNIPVNQCYVGYTIFPN